MIAISVVLIIKDDFTLLECALKTFSAVVYPTDKFEVIVIDDGSDVPVQQCIDLDVSFPLNIYYIPRTTRSCRAGARNFGASKAKFDYLMFMDGDHIVENDILSRYNRYFEIRRNRSVVLGTRRETDRSDRMNILKGFKEDGHLLEKFRTRYMPDERLKLLAQLNGNVSELKGIWHLCWSCNFCIKKSAFEAIGGFDEKFIAWGFEDVELGYRLHLKGYEFDILDNYVWHLHPVLIRTEHAKYASWVKNLLYFYKKHDDLRILEQFEFENIFFYKTGIAVESDPLDVDWVHSYMNFEKKLRYMESNLELFKF